MIVAGLRFDTSGLRDRRIALDGADAVDIRIRAQAPAGPVSTRTIRARRGATRHPDGCHGSYAKDDEDDLRPDGRAAAGARGRLREDACGGRPRRPARQHVRRSSLPRAARQEGALLHPLGRREGALGAGCRGRLRARRERRPRPRAPALLDQQLRPRRARSCRRRRPTARTSASSCATSRRSASASSACGTRRTTSRSRRTRTRAARRAYYRMMRSICHRCTIVALDVLDQRGVQGYISRWFRALPRSYRHSRIYIGIHNYSDTNRLRSRGTSAIIRAARALQPPRQVLADRDRRRREVRRRVPVQREARGVADRATCSSWRGSSGSTHQPPVRVQLDRQQLPGLRRRAGARRRLDAPRATGRSSPRRAASPARTRSRSQLAEPLLGVACAFVVAARGCAGALAAAVQLRRGRSVLLGEPLLLLGLAPQALRLVAVLLELAAMGLGLLLGLWRAFAALASSSWRWPCASVVEPVAQRLVAAPCGG